MATLTKKDLLEAIEDMPMDADTNDIFARLMLNDRLECDFRAKQMRTVLENRKRYALLKSNRVETKIYDDCLAILNKEFFELNLPHDHSIDVMIHEVKDKIIEKIWPINKREPHTVEWKRVGMVAGIIESLCYEMFNHGYNYNKRIKSKESC